MQYQLMYDKMLLPMIIEACFDLTMKCMHQCTRKDVRCGIASAY